MTKPEAPLADDPNSSRRPKRKAAMRAKATVKRITLGGTREDADADEEMMNSRTVNPSSLHSLHTVSEPLLLTSRPLPKHDARRTAPPDPACYLRQERTRKTGMNDMSTGPSEARPKMRIVLRSKNKVNNQSQSEAMMTREGQVQVVNIDNDNNIPEIQVGQPSPPRRRSDRTRTAAVPRGATPGTEKPTPRVWAQQVGPIRANFVPMPQPPVATWHARRPDKSGFRTNRPNALRLAPVNTIIANTTPLTPALLKSSPRIYEEIEHLQSRPRVASISGQAHPILRGQNAPATGGYLQVESQLNSSRAVTVRDLNALGHPPKATGASPKKQALRNSQPQIRQVLRNPEENPVQMHAMAIRSLAWRGDAHNAFEIDQHKLILRMLKSNKDELAKMDRAPMTLQLAPRQPLTPSFTDLAIGKMRSVSRTPIESGMFIPAGIQFPRRLSDQDTQGCSFCLFSCDFGISDTRLWLPAEAASGFCFDCLREVSTFNDDWFTDRRSLICRLPSRLLNTSTQNPLVEASNAMGFASMASKFTYQYRADALRSSNELGAEMKQPQKVVRSSLDGNDVTKYQRVLFCKGCSWRQIDITKARICMDCKAEKFEIIKHRHLKFRRLDGAQELRERGQPAQKMSVRYRQCMICTNLAFAVCEGCPLRLCDVCETELVFSCKGHLTSLFYHYGRMHIRNDAFLLRADGGGF